MNFPQSGLIRLVALFKLLKAALLIIGGIGLLKLIHMDVATELDHWIVKLGFDPGSRYVNHAIQKATNLSPNRIKELGLEQFCLCGSVSHRRHRLMALETLGRVAHRHHHIFARAS